MVFLKIPLAIEASDKISLSAILKCSRRNILLSVKFIIDTGSPFTFLGWDDAAKQERLLKNLRIKETALMGGGKMNIAEIPDAVALMFKNENGELCALELPNFSLADRPSKKGDMFSPSIIGLDFLRSNNFKLVVDMKNKQAYLERD